MANLHESWYIFISHFRNVLHLSFTKLNGLSTSAMDGRISAAESVTLWFCHVKPHNPIHPLLQHDIKIVGLLIHKILSPSPTFCCLDWLSHYGNRLLIFCCCFNYMKVLFWKRKHFNVYKCFMLEFCSIRSRPPKVFCKKRCS